MSRDAQGATMLILLLILAQSTTQPKVINNSNIANVQSCHCKPTEAQLAGIRARQYVYVEPVPPGPSVYISGGYYGENLIRVRPMILAYPYDLGRERYSSQRYDIYRRPFIPQPRRR
jgi:hypothetical protein